VRSQGEVWLADLNPRHGAEPGKARPVLIVQNQALLDVDHPSTVVIPLTTNLVDNALPLRVRVKAQDRLEKDSDLLIDQLRSIDNARLTGVPLATLDTTVLRQVGEAVREVLGLDDLRT
jgi:mRNA interferase MazF